MLGAGSMNDGIHDNLLILSSLDTQPSCIFLLAICYLNEYTNITEVIITTHHVDAHMYMHNKALLC